MFCSPFSLWCLRGTFIAKPEKGTKLKVIFTMNRWCGFWWQKLPMRSLSRWNSVCFLPDWNPSFYEPKGDVFCFCERLFSIKKHARFDFFWIREFVGWYISPSKKNHRFMTWTSHTSKFPCPFPHPFFPLVNTTPHSIPKLPHFTTQPPLNNRCAQPMEDHAGSFSRDLRGWSRDARLQSTDRGASFRGWVELSSKWLLRIPTKILGLNEDLFFFWTSERSGREWWTCQLLGFSDHFQGIRSFSREFSYWKNLVFRPDSPNEEFVAGGSRDSQKNMKPVPSLKLT